MPPTLSLSRVPILVVFTLYAIAFGLSVPAYPILLNQYTFDDMGKAVLLIGLSNFIKHFLEFFSTPVLGSMSDSLGRKPILLFSLVIVSIESYSVAVYPSIACMMMARVFAGLGDCCFLIAYTIITDISVLNGDNLTQGYGWLSGCFSLGFVVGPLLGIVVIILHNYESTLSCMNRILYSTAVWKPRSVSIGGSMHNDCLCLRLVLCRGK
jgi:DHA1 family tetracycline resistance protein-like MFS transporter